MRRSASFSSRSTLAMVILVIAAPFASATGIKSDRVLARILTETPSAILVPSGQQWQRAEESAASTPGAFAFWGVGASMEPLFPHQTAIVVAPVDFDELKQGMTVVYCTRLGRMVAHSLTADVPDGWIAQGINNSVEDDELVTRENLVGVIVEAYSAIPSAQRTALLDQLVAKRRRRPANS